MLSSWTFYISTLVVYFGVDLLSGISLNLQYGYAGVINFGYIVFQAAGAYAAAVVTLGPSGGAGSFQKYIFGANLPFPLPLLVATAAGAILAGFVGLFSLRRIRRDYQAAVLLIVSLIAIQVVQADIPLFNGSNGLTGVPRPLVNVLPLSLQGYQWAYAGWVLLLCALVYLLVRWLSRSPWGRALRAMRDQEDAAVAIGLNVTALRLQVFVIGGAIAGLSGGLLVEFIGAWSPDAWGYAETFVIFTAIFVGGVRNYRGVLLGVLLVPIIFLQLPQFLPPIGYPGLVQSLEWVIIGVLWMLCLLLRPSGLLPERRAKALPDLSGRVA
ncbi:MAG TPA: branched-chain amino acid ABC transporter permease [Streptosporangiaceae bacterium]|nr:branched-chain amino acid ABC transporter permease [Streptosporangiaceae bacterium]